MLLIVVFLFLPTVGEMYGNKKLQHGLKIAYPWCLSAKLFFFLHI